MSTRLQLQEARRFKHALSESQSAQAMAAYEESPPAPRTYSLPDETVVALEDKRFEDVADLFLDPSPLVAAGLVPQPPEFDVSAPFQSNVSPGAMPPSMPLHQMLFSAVAQCERENQAVLMKNLIVAGGSGSVWPYLPDKLKTEVRHALGGTRMQQSATKNL